MGMFPYRLEFVEDKTKQSFKKECDINFILAQFSKTGVLPQSGREPRYGDFSNVPDYQAALNLVHTAEDLFERIPEKVRERFGNDPGRFLAFVSNPDNADKLVEMGLAMKPVEPASGPAQPAPREGGGTPAKPVFALEPPQAPVPLTPKEVKAL